MKKVSFLFAIATFLFAGSITAAAPASACTKAQIADGRTPFDCAISALQCAGLDATRGQPFVAVVVSIDDELMGAVWAHRRHELPLARDQVAIYAARIARLAADDPNHHRVSVVDARRVADLSAAVMRLLQP